MTVKCGKEIDTCLKYPDVDWVYDSGDTYALHHNKDIKEDITVGEVVIPVRHRLRSFNLLKHDERLKKDLTIINDTQGNDSECFVAEDTYLLTISDSINITDSDLYIVDTHNNNCFWKEYRSTCQFSKTSSESARFNAPANTFHKWIHPAINANVTITWKLMLNGVVETIHQESYVKSLYSEQHPLIILWPIPLSTGIPVDPDIIKYGYFYDYFAGGEEGLIRTDGGADFYYPEWMRMMTLHREADQADAHRRYDYTWGADPNRQPSYQLQTPEPLLYGSDDPRGSIIRDYAGNTFASVTVTKSNGDLLHHNRLVDQNGADLVMPDILAGSSARYYPLGLI